MDYYDDEDDFEYEDNDNLEEELLREEELIRDNFLEDYSNQSPIFTKEKKTAPYLNTYEKIALIAQRAKSLEQGANPLISIPDTIRGNYPAIAEKELEEAVTGKVVFPLNVIRILPNGNKEEWKISDFKYLKRF